MQHLARDRTLVSLQINLEPCSALDEKGAEVSRRLTVKRPSHQSLPDNCVFMSHPNVGVHAPSRCITQTVRQHRAIANFGISSRSSRAFISVEAIRAAFARSQFTLDAWSVKSAFDTNSVIGTGRCKPV
jgi:hypothetical protein